MSGELEKTAFSKLPNWVQAKIKELGPTKPEEYEGWIQRKIPALGNRSVVETINSSDGEQALKEYFSRVMGRF